MWRSRKVRVITPSPSTDDDGSTRSTPLGEVFASDEWATAVAASPLAAHYLTSMDYDEFVAAPSSRVLSYRWSKLLRLDCAVRDPAEAETRFVGDVALSVLDTPTLDGVGAVWADALNHLNSTEGLAMSLRTMGGIYLAVPTLPQYFVLGSVDATEAAMKRGWMHQEVAYGALDARAVECFVELCVQRHQEQTGGQRFRGNPFYLEGPKLLAALVAKRCRACAELANSCFPAMVWCKFHSPPRH